MASISAMSCPQCGAGIQHDKHASGAANSNRSECAYCGSLLAVTHSRQPDLRNQKYTRTGSNASPRQHCPRCYHKLATSRIGKSHLGNCHQCGGVWLPTKALEHLKRVSRKTRHHYARINRPRNPRQRHQSYDQHHAIHCPICSALMNAKIYRGDHTVVVDVCASHGVWFDARELSLAHKNGRSRSFRNHRNRDRDRDRDHFLGDWDFLFRGGWRRYHPAYLLLRIVAEIIEEIFD